MMMRIDKQLFAEKLKRLKGIIPTSGMVESLQGVLVADGMVTANNLNYGMQVPLNVSDCTERFFLSQKAIDLIQRLPGGMMDIEVGEDYSVQIRIGNISNKFSGINPDTVPKLPVIEKSEKTWVDAEEFLTAIKTVIYATEKMHPRQVMAAVALLAEDGLLNIVATDSHRLAWYQMEYLEQMSLIIPADAAQQLIKANLTDKLTIHDNKNNALFETEDCRFFTRTVAESYVNYQMLFKDMQNSNLTVDKRKLIDALERASISADNNIVRLHFHDDDVLTVKAQSQYGQFTEDIEVDGPKEDFTIACNVKFVLDALKSHPEDVIKGVVKGPLAPIFFKNESLKTLFLPVRA